LYAFVGDGNVFYIGKTGRSIRQRFTGYCRPVESQSTNTRCNAKIREAIAVNLDVRILIFTPITQIQYGDFGLDIAAGLEESLIKAFNPPWNGHRRNRPVTEEAEREEQGEIATMQEVDDPVVGPGLAKFTIMLGATYYNKGFVNV